MGRDDRRGYPTQGELLAVPAPAEREVDGRGVALPVAGVLLDSPVAHLDRIFDYRVPVELDAAAAVGTAVTVRFNHQDHRGWVWRRGSTTTHPGRLASVRSVVSGLPLLTADTRRLVEAVAARSAGVRADVVRLSVPPRHATTEREERDQEVPPPRTWRAPGPGTGWQVYGGDGFVASLAQGDAPRAVWTALPERPGLVRSWISLLADAARAALSGGRGVLVVVSTASRAEAVAAALAAELDGPGGGGTVVALTAEGGPSRRYRAFLRALTGRARVVVGTRAAAFAPVADLGLAVVWDDGDDRLAEPHAPYVHTRTVLALRSGLEKAGLLVAGYSRSVEAQGYVERGWAQELSADRPLRRQAVARVAVPSGGEVGQGPAAARIPSPAHRAVRDALADGPVLVQVPRGGYAPVMACGNCREVAVCPHCGGPLAMRTAGTVTCRWCARTVVDWTCPHCGDGRLRMRASGSTRTGEELGRAFPGTPVVVSGAGESHGVVATVDASPRLVVATPGAEPMAGGGYRAVLLLDGGLMSSRPELGAGVSALRRWTNAVVLARSDARVFLLGHPDPATAQALVRWDHAGLAHTDLAERAELHLPPAWRTARVDGPREAVEGLLSRAEAEGFEVLGPAPVPEATGRDGAAPTVSVVDPSGTAAGVRALVRTPVTRGHDLADLLRAWKRERSAHRDETVRIELDPTVLW